MRESATTEPQPQTGVHFDTRLPKLSRWRRMQIPVIATAVFCVVRILGPTLRYEILGWEQVERVYAGGKRCIWSFWHRAIFGVIWHGRNRGVVVMNSTNFDGQWTRKVIEWLGYGTAQGSSTRGGLRGLAAMAERLEQGLDVAFTIDGPRGPRFVAKPGPVMLARRTGCPILVFHVGLERAHTFQTTWDLFQLPYPFSRAVMLCAPPIYVPQDADRETMAQKHEQMQKELERVRAVTESWFSTPEEERARFRATLR